MIFKSKDKKVRKTAVVSFSGLGDSPALELLSPDRSRDAALSYLIGSLEERGLRPGLDQGKKIYIGIEAISSTDASIKRFNECRVALFLYVLNEYFGLNHTETGETGDGKCSCVKAALGSIRFVSETIVRAEEYIQIMRLTQSGNELARLFITGKSNNSPMINVECDCDELVTTLVRSGLQIKPLREVVVCRKGIRVSALRALEDGIKSGAKAAKIMPNLLCGSAKGYEYAVAYEISI